APAQSSYNASSGIASMLNQKRATIENDQAKLTRMQSQLATLCREIESERPFASYYDQSGIDRVNDNEDRCNRLLQQASAQQTQLNEMIDSYNSELSSYG